MSGFGRDLLWGSGPPTLTSVPSSPLPFRPLLSGGVTYCRGYWPVDRHTGRQTVLKVDPGKCGGIL